MKLTPDIPMKFIHLAIKRLTQLLVREIVHRTLLQRHWNSRTCAPARCTTGAGPTCSNTAAAGATYCSTGACVTNTTAMGITTVTDAAHTACDSAVCSTSRACAKLQCCAGAVRKTITGAIPALSGHNADGAGGHEEHHNKLGRVRMLFCFGSPPRSCPFPAGAVLLARRVVHKTAYCALTAVLDVCCSPSQLSLASASSPRTAA